nr:MAG TPA: hypothetical protein [Caudoviricetes sp.]
MQVRNRSAHHPNEKDEGEEIVQQEIAVSISLRIHVSR